MLTEIIKTVLEIIEIIKIVLEIIKNMKTGKFACDNLIKIMITKMRQLNNKKCINILIDDGKYSSDSEIA